MRAQLPGADASAFQARAQALQLASLLLVLGFELASGMLGLLELIVELARGLRRGSDLGSQCLHPLLRLQVGRSGATCGLLLGTERADVALGGIEPAQGGLLLLQGGRNPFAASHDLAERGGSLVERLQDDLQTEIAAAHATASGASVSGRPDPCRAAVGR